MHLFAYGTLMFADVWQRIDLGEFESQPASLQGFSIYRIRDAVFPGILQTDDGSRVNGRVFRELDEETLFELDTYESELYERMEVDVTLQDGTTLACQTYVIPASRREALSDQPWDAARFEQHELKNYLKG